MRDRSTLPSVWERNDGIAGNVLTSKVRSAEARGIIMPLCEGPFCVS
jgi:hypothetical protein